MYVSGAPTEFMIGDIAMPQAKNNAEFNNAFKDHTNETMFIPLNTIVKYDGHAIHKAGWDGKYRIRYRLLFNERKMYEQTRRVK